MKEIGINHASYNNEPQEFSKSELEEAGVAIKYRDDKTSSKNIEEPLNQKKRKDKTPQYRKWILLFILLVFVSIIVKVGNMHINEEVLITSYYENFDVEEAYLN